MSKQLVALTIIILKICAVISAFLSFPFITTNIAIITIKLLEIQNNSLKNVQKVKELPEIHAVTKITKR